MSSLLSVPLAHGVVDRRDEVRGDAREMASLLKAVTTRFVVMYGTKVALEESGESVMFMRRDDVCVESLTPSVYLGRYEGIDYVAVSHNEDEVAGVALAGLREMYGLVPAWQAELVATASAMVSWGRACAYCGVCGGQTIARHAGWRRTCLVCEKEHFPRTDVATIVAVVDDEERALFARGRGWPEGRFSHVAGFLEPGESVETCVRREVLEEVGVTVGWPSYVASQPWPFPGSLMVAMCARAESSEINVDGEEVVEARWFSREEYVAAVESGEVRRPPSELSVSTVLTKRWLDAHLPIPNCGHL